MKTLTDEKAHDRRGSRYDWFEYGSDSHHDGTYF